MSLTVKHHYQTARTNNAAKDVSSTRWNEGHDITGSDQTTDVQAALDGASSPSAGNVFATMADAGGSLPSGWTETADGVEVTGVLGNVFLKVLRQNSTATGNVSGTEVFVAFMRVYNSILLDDAALIATDSFGATFFEVDPGGNVGTGAVKVHGVEVTGGPGVDGADGTSFLAAAHAPDDTNDGIDGDSYLDTSTGDIYGPKASGAWGASTGSISDFIPEAVVPDTAYDDAIDEEFASLVQGSGTAAVGACDVRIKRLGREVHARVSFLAGAVTGEMGEPWVLTMPSTFPAAENTSGTSGPYVAGCGFVDAGVGVLVPVTAVWSGAAEGARGLKMIGPDGEVGSDMAVQLLAGAVVQLNLVYEAAAAA